MQTMPLKKLLGLVVMAAGIAWYSHIKLTEAPSPRAHPTATAEQNGDQAGNAENHSKAREVGRGLPPLVPAEQQRPIRGPAWGGQIVSPRKGSHFDP